MNEYKKATPEDIGKIIQFRTVCTSTGDWLKRGWVNAIFAGQVHGVYRRVGNAYCALVRSNGGESHKVLFYKEARVRL